MGDLSFVFEPSDMVSKTGIASDLGSSALVKASDASSKAVVAQSKASDVSSALAVRQRVVILKVYNEASAIATGDGKMYFAVPDELSGLDLKSCGAHLYTAGSGLTQVQLHNVDSAVDMLTSKIEIDTAEKDSKDATSAAVINTGADGVATGEEIRVDIDAAASGAKGLEVRAAFG
jgi:hypothetical protein